MYFMKVAILLAVCVAAYGQNDSSDGKSASPTDQQQSAPDQSEPQQQQDQQQQQQDGPAPSNDQQPSDQSSQTDAGARPESPFNIPGYPSFKGSFDSLYPSSSFLGDSSPSFYNSPSSSFFNSPSSSFFNNPSPFFGPSFYEPKPLDIPNKRVSVFGGDGITRTVDYTNVFNDKHGDEPVSLTRGSIIKSEFKPLTYTATAYASPTITSIRAPTITAVHAPTVTAIHTPTVATVHAPTVTAVHTPAVVHAPATVTSTTYHAPAVTAVHTPAVVPVNTPVVTAIHTPVYPKVAYPAVSRISPYPYVPYTVIH